MMWSIADSAWILELELQTFLQRCHIVSPGLTKDTPIPYSIEAHCDLIAIWCAANNCPYNMVTDLEYYQELNMLHPNTPIPHPSTVSKDIQTLYLTAAILFQQFLAVYSPGSLNFLITDFPMLQNISSALHLTNGQLYFLTLPFLLSLPQSPSTDYTMPEMST
jgi:hypothetical protein